MRADRSGQSLMEYAILIGIVVAAMVGMQSYAKRGIQQGIKVAADRMSPLNVADPKADPQGELAQVEGMRYESGDRTNKDPSTPGTVLEQASSTRTNAKRGTWVSLHPDGAITREAKPEDYNVTTVTGAVSQKGAGVASYSRTVVGPD